MAAIWAVPFAFASLLAARLLTTGCQLDYGLVFAFGVVVYGVYYYTYCSAYGRADGACNDEAGGGACRRPLLHVRAAASQKARAQDDGREDKRVPNRHEEPHVCQRPLAWKPASQKPDKNRPGVEVILTRPYSAHQQTRQVRDGEISVLLVSLVHFVDHHANAGADRGADRSSNDKSCRGACGGALFHVAAARAKHGEAKQGSCGKGKNRYAGHWLAPFDSC